MTSRKELVEPGPPMTLRQAHELLGPKRPEDSAPVAVRVAFYRESSRVYARIAEVDRGHHHEALYWASRERERADRIEAMAKGVSGAGGS